jgi:hypothetical protein
MWRSQFWNVLSIASITAERRDPLFEVTPEDRLQFDAALYATRYLPQFVVAARYCNLPIRAVSIVEGENFWIEPTGDELVSAFPPGSTRVFVVSEESTLERFLPHLAQHSRQYTVKITSPQLLHQHGVVPKDLLLLGSDVVGYYDMAAKHRLGFLTEDSTLLDQFFQQYEQINAAAIQYIPDSPGSDKRVEEALFHSSSKFRTVKGVKSAGRIIIRDERLSLPAESVKSSEPPNLPPHADRSFDEPPEEPPPSAPRPTFYFILKGDAVVGDQVKCDSDVDLVFNYDVPSDDVLATVTGRSLQEIRQQSGLLDLTIIPHGFLIRDRVCSKTASFRESRLEKPVVFCLKAHEQPLENSGLLVLFRVHGCLLYECYLNISLVTTLPRLEAQRQWNPIDINLDEILEEAKHRDKRDYELTIYSSGGQYQIGRTHNGQQLPLLSSSRVHPASLDPLLQQIKALVQKVVEHQVFSIETFHALNPVQHPAAKAALDECLRLLATAGWRLYNSLRQDPAFLTVLNEISALPPHSRDVSSRIAIHTDHCFIPWGILYPYDYNCERQNPPPPDHQQFWGYRYHIECLLIGDSPKTATKSSRYRVKPIHKPFVSLNVNPTIDGTLTDNLGLARQSHKTFFTRSVPMLNGELLNDPQKIKALLQQIQAPATFLYFYCHGRNQNPYQPSQTEELELAPNITINPHFLPEGIMFPNKPVVFLNSCSSGAFSSLSLLNFHAKFKSAGAAGLIVTDFSVPVAFAAAFGQEIIRRYLHGQKLGEALLEFRRQLLDQKNPLGLLYSLQCPMDLRAHLEEPAA